MENRKVEKKNRGSERMKLIKFIVEFRDSWTQSLTP